MTVSLWLRCPWNASFRLTKSFPLLLIRNEKSFSLSRLDQKCLFFLSFFLSKKKKKDLTVNQIRMTLHFRNVHCQCWNMIMNQSTSFLHNCFAKCETLVSVQYLNGPSLKLAPKFLIAKAVSWSFFLHSFYQLLSRSFFLLIMLPLSFFCVCYHVFIHVYASDDSFLLRFSICSLNLYIYSQLSPPPSQSVFWSLIVFGTICW